MAFATPAVRLTGGDTTLVSSHPVATPAGVAVGNLLLVVFGFDGTAGQATLTIDPDNSGPGWVKLTQVNTTTGGGGPCTALFYKHVTTLAESNALTILSGGLADEAQYIHFRIPGGGVPAFASLVGNAANTNPPALTPPGGVRDWVWIAARIGDTTSTATAAPANYANLTTSTTASGAGCTVNTAERSLAVATEDPGAFTVVADDFVAYTIVIPPTNTLSGTESATVTDTAQVGQAGTDAATVTDPPATVVKATVASLSGAADVVVEPLALRGSKGAALARVDTVVEVLPLRVSKGVRIGTVPVVADPRPMFAGGTAPRPADVVVEPLPLQVGYGGQVESRAARTVKPVRFAPAGRFIAQSIITGEFLSWELPITDPAVTWRLSGPTDITGSFRPEIRDLRDLGLEPWGTWIHYEEADEIRASAILLPTSIGEDGTWTLSASGPSNYAGQVPYVSTYRGIDVDPADVVRHLWAHVQSFPRGNLGLVVTGSTPVRIGEPEREVEFTTDAGEEVAFTAGPHKIDWHEGTFCGKEVDDLARDTPFDYAERAQWRDSTRTVVDHYLDIGYPKIGRRLIDEVFRQGENITEYAPPEEPPGAYADSVYFHGKGEGADAIAAFAGVHVPTRLRLPAVVQDKTVGTVARGQAIAADELAARLSALVEIPEVVVDTTSPNARLGTFGPGDEGLIQLTSVPYVERISAYHRIIGMTYYPLIQRAALTLTRRDEFMEGRG